MHATPAKPLRNCAWRIYRCKSFVTALDEHEASQGAGGYPWATRVSACFAASINLCENPSLYPQNHNC